MTSRTYSRHRRAATAREVLPERLRRASAMLVVAAVAIGAMPERAHAQATADVPAPIPDPVASPAGPPLVERIDAPMLVPAGGEVRSSPVASGALLFVASPGSALFVTGRVSSEWMQIRLIGGDFAYILASAFTQAPAVNPLPAQSTIASPAPAATTGDAPSAATPAPIVVAPFPMPSSTGAAPPSAAADAPAPAPSGAVAAPVAPGPAPLPLGGVPLAGAQTPVAPLPSVSVPTTSVPTTSAPTTPAPTTPAPTTSAPESQPAPVAPPVAAPSATGTPAAPGPTVAEGSGQAAPAAPVAAPPATASTPSPDVAGQPASTPASPPADTAPATPALDEPVVVAERAGVLRNAVGPRALQVAQVRAGQQFTLLRETRGPDNQVWAEVKPQGGAAGFMPRKDLVTLAEWSEPVNGMVTKVVDAATVVIGARTVRIGAIEAGPVRFLDVVRPWLTGPASPLTCERRPDAAFDCFSADRRDVGETMILNGLARAAAGAPAYYLEAQDKAKQGKKGLWRSVR